MCPLINISKKMKKLPRINADLRGSDRDFDKEVVYNPEVPMLIKAIQNRSASFKRGLGLLLVLFIFYGTTVEAAHRHGVAAPQSNSATSVTNPNSGASSTFGTRPGCSDCLICQLHQNFSATLIR